MGLKRFAAPAFWPVEKKTKKFVMKPFPGPHSRETCMPLGLVIRDIMGYAKNASEMKHILNNGHVKVDGVVRKAGRFPVGLMDVLSIGSENYRVVSRGRGLHIIKIAEKEAGVKLLRIENKTVVSKGKIQLNFHDGKNLLVGKDSYKTGDVVVFDIEKGDIKSVIGLGKGSLVLITGGHNTGKTGVMEEVIVTRSSMPNQAVVKVGGQVITLPRNYVFAVGKDSPAVSLGEHK